MSAAEATGGENVREEQHPRHTDPPNRRRGDRAARLGEDGGARPEHRPQRRAEPSARTRPERAEPTERPRPAEAAPTRYKLSAAKVARLAMEQVVGLIARDPEVVTSVEHTDDGWRVGIEVVESHRIPDSADILAVYQADLDADGDLLAYRRIKRYPRGRGQED